MDNEVERKAVGNLTVRVVNDADGGTNPREWSNMGTFYTSHPRYISPDQHPNSCWSLVDQVSHELKLSSSGTPAILLAKARKAGHVVLPVWLYDHSGCTYVASETNPFSCRWDSGMVGFIFVAREDLQREYSCNNVTKAVREKAEAALRSEVEVWSHWAAGDVWGFVVEDPDGETLDSCWGFVGGSDEIAYCLEQGVDAAEHFMAVAA